MYRSSEQQIPLFCLPLGTEGFSGANSSLEEHGISEEAGRPPGGSAVVRFLESMDLHKLAAERSLAFHRVIARRLVRDPAVLERARERVKLWLAQTPDRPFARQWEKVLAGNTESVASFLISRSEPAEELRQSSPFAGVLDARERWRIWRETRESFSGER